MDRAAECNRREGVDVELNQSLELDRAAQARSAAALFFHEPQQMRLPSFDAKSPFKGAQTLLVGQPSPSAAEPQALRAFDRHARCRDPGRRWLVTATGGGRIIGRPGRDLSRVAGGALRLVPGTQQPATIRRLASDKGTLRLYFTEQFSLADPRDGRHRVAARR